VHDVLKLIPSLRNLLLPVNRLLPETLSRIAQFMDEDAIDTRSIISLTHVCRYWRESIVSTPRSWTLVSSERINLAELSLERCRAVPLELWLDMTQVRANPEFTARIAPHVQNIGALRMNCISSPQDLAQTFPGFPQSMPNLRSFSFSPGPLHPSQDWSVDPFGAATPALTHLSLAYVPLYPSLRRLTTLTDLSLRNHDFKLHLDTFLDFLEGNRALERANLDVWFTPSSLQNLRVRDVIANRLQTLSISSADAEGGGALISRIALQKGATLEVTLDGGARLSDVLTVASAVNHLPNSHSATFMEYHSDERNIRQLGPNGTFSFKCVSSPEDPLAELPLLHLTNVREFHLVRRFLAVNLGESPDGLARITFPPPSLPALETLAIEREVHTPELFSALFSDPSASPSLKTIAFMDCELDEGFMGALTRYAADRKNTTSAPLHRVVIVNSKGTLPGVASIGALGAHVPVVDVRIGKKLPTDLI